MVSTAEAVSFAEIPRVVQTGQNAGATAKIRLSGASVEVSPRADTEIVLSDIKCNYPMYIACGYQTMPPGKMTASVVVAAHKRYKKHKYTPDEPPESVPVEVV